MRTLCHTLLLPCVLVSLLPVPVPVLAWGVMSHGGLEQGPTVCTWTGHNLKFQDLRVQ